MLKLTREDLLRFPKERLVEIILEMQEENNVSMPTPIIIDGGNNNPPCYAPNGICTNPFHDCVNCPRMFGWGYERTISVTSYTVPKTSFGNTSGSQAQSQQTQLND